MGLSFPTAKNGELTSSYNGLFLHSTYNPSREAKKFVDNINLPYIPPYIVITEPGLGYTVTLLQEKFPTSKIIIIRFISGFEKFNNNADFVINFYEKNINLSSKLLNIIGEDKIINTLFLQWTPASLIFKDLDRKYINNIKSIFEKSKTILVTREYYEKKWLLNSINFIRYSQNIYKIENKIDIPIVIVSSGPSTKDAINIIKNHRKSLFVISLSSGIKLCLDNNIIPDLFFSTDGGYWAGTHLKSLLRQNKFNNIPLVVPIESYVQKSILSTYPLIPLDYNDGLSHDLIIKSQLPSMCGERNGTVAGTALMFALSYSNSSIYLCGLDMSNQIGFQHCQPNEIEINNSIFDNKIKSLEKRNAIGQYSKGVLSLYKEWFDQVDFDKRNVFRVINSKYKNNSLGKIKDISPNEFQIKLKNDKYTNNNNYIIKSNWKKLISNLFDYIDTNISSKEWQNNLFPLSMSTLMHDKNNNDILNRLKLENDRLLNKIRKIING